MIHIHTGALATMRPGHVTCLYVPYAPQSALLNYVRDVKEGEVLLVLGRRTERYATSGANPSDWVNVLSSADGSLYIAHSQWLHPYGEQT